MLPTFERSLDPKACLAPTSFIDVHSTPIVEVARSLATGASPAERATAIFRFVRDQLEYRFQACMNREDYVASTILGQAGGFCVQKAIVAAALGRAAGIPTALVLSDLRDRSLPPHVTAALGTDIMFHHGLTAFHLEGVWRIADASLSPRLVNRKRYRAVELGGDGDAVQSSTTLDGEPHAEYLRIHGLYADLPFDQMLTAFRAGYARADASLLAGMGLAP